MSGIPHWFPVVRRFLARNSSVGPLTHADRALFQVACNGVSAQSVPAKPVSAKSATDASDESQVAKYLHVADRGPAAQIVRLAAYPGASPYIRIIERFGSFCRAEVSAASRWQ